MKIAFEKQKFGRRWFATPETFPAAMNRGASLPRQLIVRKSVCRRTEWCAPSVLELLPLDLGRARFCAP
jgi:hypothetical protein